ncbi:hypothetical protein M8J75_010449 [Diaphorina citri]|nr:hypothetical protein M8J75_010449 [Diaphorina citri]
MFLLVVVVKYFTVGTLSNHGGSSVQSLATELGRRSQYLSISDTLVRSGLGYLALDISAPRDGWKSNIYDYTLDCWGFYTHYIHSLMKYGDAAHQHEEDTPRYDAAEEQDGHAAAQEQNGQAVAQEQDGHVAAHEHDGHVAAHEQDGHVATHEQDGHVMAHEWDGHVVAHERDRHVTAYEQEAYVTDSCSTLSNTLAQLQEQLDNIQKQLKGLQKSITPQEIKTASAQIPNVTQGKNINIFTVGDSHVRDLKTIMESKLPKNLSVDHSFIPGGRFHDISSKCIKKYENCDHLIVMAGTNDIGKTSFKEIKTHIENIIIKFKDSKIHLVLVPDRFDKVTMNLDIKILNDKIKTLVKDYKNITIYHTTSIVDSWDYCDNIHFGPNGNIEILKGDLRS